MIAKPIWIGVGLWCGILSQVLAESAFDSATFNQTSSPLKLVRITPHGDSVPAHNRQIVFKFNQPIVPVGDMQRSGENIPVTITPNVECEWLWLDTSSLSCQLSRSTQLQEATRYQIEMAPGIVSVSGASLSESVLHQFTTERPRLTRVRLHNWTRAERPVVSLYFNQPVSRSSVLRTVSFAADNVIPVIIERDYNAIADALYLQATANSDFISVPALNSRTNDAAHLALVNQKLAEREQAHDRARQVWNVSPAHNLPADQSVSIKVAAGLASVLGLEKSVPLMAEHRFQSLPEFTFQGVVCYPKGNYSEELRLPPLHASSESLRSVEEASNHEDTDSACDPLNRVSLEFSTPVSYATAKAHLAISPDLAGGRTDYDPWSARNDEYSIRSWYDNRFNYEGKRPYRLMLPEVLKAYEQYAVVSNTELRDENGRALNAPIDMAFLTSHRTSRLWFSHWNSVLEHGVDSELPVNVTNLTELQVSNFSRVTASGREENLSYTKTLPKVEDIAYRVPLGVREMLNGQSGLVTGSLSSTPHINIHRDKRFVSQVTPFQVHAKFGHFNSLVWVTNMATGEPVEGASISIETETYATISPLTTGKGMVETDRDGLATLPGIEELNPNLSRYGGYSYDAERLMVKVRKDDDIAILPLDSNFRAWPQISHQLQPTGGYSHAWGTTAQGIYKAGDTVQFKLYVRNQDNRHWIAADRTGYRLEVIDPKGQTVHAVESLELSDFGAYSGEFTSPSNAAVGWYQFRLFYSANKVTRTFSPMRVLISDFTPAPFRVTTELEGDQFQAGETLSVTSLAKMHAGGPYADAEARVTAILTDRRFTSSAPLANGFRFNSGSSVASQTVHQSNAALDKHGELKTDITLGATQLQYGRITVETAVRDDRGKSVASSASADYIGRDRFVGLRNTDWVHTAGEKVAFDVLVVDATGEPVADSAVTLSVQHRVTRAARVRGAGNAYLTQYSSEYVEVSSCEIRSSLSVEQCVFTPTDPGSFRVVATVSDSKNRVNKNTIYTWVRGEGTVVWHGANSNELEIVPDAQSYQVGDVARFLIKNPYPGAEALISVERYGVLREWRQTLDNSTPVIEVPIQGDDYPGVYLSVVVASPRVQQPLGDNNVDLGKPAFKLGYAAVPVKDNNKEIAVTVKTDKPVYRPRETVKVSLKAKPRTGKMAPMEAAVVVIDEAVFDLNRSGKGYYDPLAGFNKLDPLGVDNYNLLMQLIGRQKFEKKGANPGGGGGEEGSDLRSVMKFVAHWDPSVKLDSRGRAELQFELPDNLTGWRVFAMVVTQEERMGLGDANFKANRPTELRPVMPNHLVEGDQVQAGFSVMNRTNTPRTLTVNLLAAGDALDQQVRESRTVQLDAYERKRIWMSITAKQAGEIGFMASASDESDSDAIEHHLPVAKRRSLISAATYGTTVKSKVAENIRFPDGIYADVGGLSVTVSPSVIGNITGSFKYLRDYPYVCWEQRLSKGIAAAQYSDLKKYLPDTLQWPEATALPATTLADAETFQAPNGGMTYWINNNNYVSPYLSAYTAMGFHWLRQQGYQVPDQVEQRLHAYLKGYLRQDPVADINQSSASRRVRSSIRGVILAALAASGSIDKQTLARHQPHLPEMNLFGKAHFLNASISLGIEADELLDQARTLLSYSVQSGGKFQFNEEIFDDYGAMHYTSLRSNCAVLSSLLDLARTTPSAREVIGDIPFKQVRAITQTRGAREFWANTQENLFCMSALINFSKIYEQTSPGMLVDASFEADNGGSQKIGRTEFTDLRDPSVTLMNRDFKVQAGLSGAVELTRQGQGRLYYSVKTRFAKTEDNAERINAGIEIRREYSVQRAGRWKVLVSPMQLEKGELVRVDLFVAVPAARQFVVIDDPVPGGLEPVNRDLATASLIDAADDLYDASQDSWRSQRRTWIPYGRYGESFYHKELRHDAARFFSDYLPAGNYHLTYTAQAIAGGTFSVMPTKAEEMYDPDVYGLALPMTLDIKPAVQ